MIIYWWGWGLIFNMHYLGYCRISDLISGLHEDGIEPNILLNNLEYVQEALKYFISEHKYLSSS